LLAYMMCCLVTG